MVDIDGENDREILNFGAGVKAFASWFPNGKRVHFLAETETHRRLGVWELENVGRTQPLGGTVVVR